MAYSPKERAQALSVLKESEGWKIIEPYMRDAIKAAADAVMNSKKTKSMNDLTHYRGTYNAYSKLLFLIDKWIADGLKETDKTDD